MFNEKPPELSTKINPEDVAAQVMVLQTKDGKVGIQYPTMAKDDPAPNYPLAMELLATGLNTLANLMRQQQPEKPRIVLAPAIPKEFLVKGRFGKPDGN